jgi:class 3 adenylate cyclase/tetratricopeptide (TPR) repeat protein
MQCGAKFELTCTKCGTEVPVAAAFCFACGNQLGRTAGAPRRFASLQSYTPKHLAEKILASKTSLEGERKQVSVLFADLKSSMELLSDHDPEEAGKLLDSVLELMMEAVHRYEGIVNQVQGDGIMALFGVPLAHEDHAVRACYAALRMQESVKRYADDVLRSHGVTLRIRVGINSGEVVIRAIGSDLHTDYTAVGQTTHLAARMEQLASAGATLIAPSTLQLAEGYVLVTSQGPVPVKGLPEPVEVFELTGATPVRSRLHASAVRGLSKFVGRESELDQLRQALERAAVGQGQVVAVIGEPGVGKSRLYWELLHSHRAREWLIIGGTSLSYGKATAYLPVIDLLKGYFQIEERDDSRKIQEKVTGKVFSLDRALEPAVPALLSLLDVLRGGDDQWEQLDSLQRRRQILDGVKRVLLRESQVQPLILLFEDLHWIDSETQALLDSLVESVATTRILLLVNYRPEYQHGWAGKSYYRQLHIDPLAPQSADELLASLVGTDKSVEPLKRDLIERTEGNPLFLEESVRTLVETGTLIGERGAYRLGRDALITQIPATVQTILAARIDRLLPEDKHLLQTAAVIGKDVPFVLLEAIAELPGDKLRACLARLIAAEFLYELRLFPDLEYTFTHSLTREVTHESLLRDRRVLLHARAAHALESLAAGRVDEHIERVAEHAEQGELWELALDYLERAGARALAVYANAEAASFFERALDALRHLPQDRTTLVRAVDIRFALRNALLPLGEIERILKSLKEIKPILASLGDNLRSARHAAYLCNHYFLAGEQRRAIEFGEGGLRLARENGDRLVEGELLHRLGQSYNALGEYRQAIILLEKSLEISTDKLEWKRVGATVIPSVISRIWLVNALNECGEFEAGIAHAKQALKIAEDAEHPLSETLAWWSIGSLLRRKGEIEGAIGALERGIRLCDHWGFRVWRPRFASSLGVAYARAGRLDEGLPLAQDALLSAEQMGLVVDMAMLLVCLGQVSLVAGQIDDALLHGKRAVEIAVAHEGKGDEAWARFLLARAHWASSSRNIDEAARELEIALRLALACEARPLAAFCQITFGGIHSLRGDHATAQQFTAAANATCAELDMRPPPLDPVH